MRQQHAVVGAAILLPCENERRRSLGAERECDVCRLGGRAAIDSGSHGGGGGLVGGSTAALFGILGFLRSTINRRRGRGVSGVFGGGPEQKRWTDKISASGQRA